MEIEREQAKQGTWQRRLVLLFATAVFVLSACNGEGLGAGPDRYSEIIKLDLADGNAQFMDSDGSGQFMQMRTHDDWITSWDQVVIGQLVDDQGSEIILFDTADGRLRIYRTNGNGRLDFESQQVGWQVGKEILVAGDFTDSYTQDLLAVDFAGQSASLQSFGGSEFVEAQAYNNWFTGWDDLSSALFSGTEHSDLFFIDYDGGFVSVQENNGSGLWTQRFFAGTWGTNWDDHTIGDFNNDGVDDVLIVDYDGGNGQFWTGNGVGGLDLWSSHTNWWQGWDEVVAGDFSGGSADDILLIDNDFDFADVIEINSSGNPVFAGRTNDWGPGYTAVVATEGRDAPVVSYQDPPAFTKEAFHIGRRSTASSLPVIAVLTERSDGPDSTLSQAGLFDLMFTGDTSVAGYFKEQSDWHVSLNPASGIGTAGPFEYTNGMDDYEIRRAIVDELATKGWDLADFDVDGDELITGDELLITFLESTDPPGSASGATTGLNPDGSCYQPHGQTVSLCLEIGSSGQESLVTTLREISHAFGALDLFTDSEASCRGFLATLMSCVGPVVHMDPWHKLDFGWETARSYRLNEPGACYTFISQESEGSEVVILWDPDRGHDEYFIVEYRTDSENDDLSDPQGGFFFWRVETDSAGVPLRKPAVILPGPDGVLDTTPSEFDIVLDGTIVEGPDFVMDSTSAATDVVLYADQITAMGVATESPVGEPGRPYNYFDYEFLLRWSDNTPVGVEFKVGPGATSGGLLAKLAWYEGDLDNAPTGGCFDEVSNP